MLWINFLQRAAWEKKRNALSTCDIPQYCYASVCLRIGFDVPLDKDRHAGLGTDT